ncbi:PilN domain-containing protein [Gorillibacterium timonense]|uniref:PilN domain-containing protein n=1 Tax=Gorillibacterium timonense TaxID=1689269 RepID=UPI00071D13E7|nr:hypothetical protein [Gorillibacterium timonense]
MKPINLLPKVPYLVKRRDFLILIVLIFALTALAVQVSLAYVWKSNKTTSEATLQRTSADVRELQSKTTLDPRSLLYAQGNAMLKQLTDARPEWVPVLDSVLAAMTYQGQIDHLAVSESRTLSLTTIVLTEEQLKECMGKLEDVPYFDKMTLHVTEHKQFREGDKAKLISFDGEVVDLTHRDYYSLDVEIQLPSVADIRKAGTP